MSRNNTVLLTPDRAIRVEGIIKTGETPKPGQVVQIDSGIALQGGRYTWKIYSTGTDGKRPVGPFIVLTEDAYQGKTMSDAYAAGNHAFGFIPLPGCEFNGLKGDVAGTGDDFAANDKLIVDDATGKFILTTGSPQTEVAVAKENVVDPTADVLVWMQWTGY